MTSPTDDASESARTIETGERPAPQAVAPPPDEPREVGRYRVVARVGEGGMGVVYRAFDPLLSRPVALKLLHGADPRQLRRFLLEARAQARVDHENVCRVFEAGVADERPFIVMQLVEGETLREAAPSMTVEEKVACLAQVAEGVHAAHRIGLIHRDIKPTNVMVERGEDGKPKPTVLDFGLVREMGGPGQTASGHVVGTPSYMAPEQALGEAEKVDRRTDVYGLGATLYEALTGRPPFVGASGVEVMMQVISREAPAPRSVAPSLPADLETIVQKCLEKEPERRYDSARALAEDLRRWLDGEPIAARPPSVLYRIGKKARKHRVAVGVSLLVLLAVVVLGGAALRERLRAGERARLAQELGEEAARIGDAMRIAHLVPLHDVRPARRRLRERVEALGAAELSGAYARGPVLYARGRAELALGDLAAARASLSRAWEEGWRAPEVSRSLGLVHAALYEEGLRAVSQIGNPELRKERRRKVEAELRDPARRYLREGTAARGTDPALAAALLDFCEERWDAALARAEEAAAKDPALYEARRLGGQVLLAQANAARERGAHAESRTFYDRAAAAFEAAAKIGESDPATYLGLGSSFAGRVELEHYDAGGEVEPWVEKGAAAFGRGLVADPDHLEILAALSNLRRLAAEALMEHGKDPGESLRLAREAAERAAAVSPAYAPAWKALAIEEIRRSAWEERQGRDPRPALAAAVAHLGRAREGGADDPATSNALGFTHNALSEAERARGGEDGGHLAEAISAFERALAVAPSLAYVRVNLGNALQDLAGVEADAGRDPRPAWEKATAAYRQALAANPSDAYALNSLGNPSLSLALFEMAHGRDPLPAIAAAEEAYRKSAALNPRYATPHLNLGWSALVRAEYLLLRGESPLAALDASREAFGKGLGINPSIPQVYAQLGELRVLEGLWLLSQRRSPLGAVEAGRSEVARSLAKAPENGAALRVRADLALVAARHRGGAEALTLLDGAARDAAKAVAENPKDGDAWLCAARVRREEAQVLLALGRDPSRAVAAGAEAAGRAEGLLPFRAEPQAEAGRLALVRARAATDPAARRGAAEEARAALARALERCPLLSLEHGAAAEEAAHLALGKGGRKS